jgi:hypothetical protein
MSNNRRLRDAVLGIALGCVSTPLFAQASGFYFTSPFELGVTRETRFIVNGVALDDNVLLFRPPTLSLLSVNPRGEVSLSYQPEIQAFEDHGDLNALNHDAQFLFTRQLNPRLTITAGDTFVSTDDPSRRVVDSVVLLPRDRLTQNALYLELSRRFGVGTTFSLRADNTITALEAPLTSATLLNDQMSTSATAVLSQRFARRHLVSASFSVVDSRPFHSDPPRLEPTTGLLILPPPAEQAQNGALSYVYEGKSTAFSVTGGLLHGRDVTYTGAAQVDQELGREATLTLSAERNLSYFAGATMPGALDVPYRLDNGMLPMSLYEAAGVRLRGDLSRKVSAALEAVIQHTFSEITLFDVDSHFARLRVDYHVSRTFAVFGTAELYRQSFNEFVGVPLEWQRFGAGVTVATSSRPNPLTARRKELARRERQERRGEATEDDAGTGSTGLSAEPTPGDTPRGETDADHGTRY